MVKKCGSRPSGESLWFGLRVTNGYLGVLSEGGIGVDVLQFVGGVKGRLGGMDGMGCVRLD